MKTVMDECNDELEKLRSRGAKGISFTVMDSAADPAAVANDLLVFLKAMNDPNTQWRSEPPHGM
jgi:hypothetical protein